jgi:hypothetical protein
MGFTGFNARGSGKEDNSDIRRTENTLLRDYAGLVLPVDTEFPCTRSSQLKDRIID